MKFKPILPISKLQSSTGEDSKLESDLLFLQQEQQSQQQSNPKLDLNGLTSNYDLMNDKKYLDMLNLLSPLEKVAFTSYSLDSPIEGSSSSNNLPPLSTTSSLNTTNTIISSAQISPVSAKQQYHPILAGENYSLYHNNDHSIPGPATQQASPIQNVFEGISLQQLIMNTNFSHPNSPSRPSLSLSEELELYLYFRKMMEEQQPHDSFRKQLNYPIVPSELSYQEQQNGVLNSVLNQASTLLSPLRFDNTTDIRPSFMLNSNQDSPNGQQDFAVANFFNSAMTNNFSDPTITGINATNNNDHNASDSTTTLITSSPTTKIAKKRGRTKKNAISPYEIKNSASLLLTPNTSSHPNYFSYPLTPNNTLPYTQQNPLNFSTTPQIQNFHSSIFAPLEIKPNLASLTIYKQNERDLNLNVDDHASKNNTNVKTKTRKPRTLKTPKTPKALKTTTDSTLNISNTTELSTATTSSKTSNKRNKKHGNGNEKEHASFTGINIKTGIDDGNTASPSLNLLSSNLIETKHEMIHTLQKQQEQGMNVVSPIREVFMTPFPKLELTTPFETNGKSFFDF